MRSIGGPVGGQSQFAGQGQPLLSFDVSIASMASIVCAWRHEGMRGMTSPLEDDRECRPAQLFRALSKVCSGGSPCRAVRGRRAPLNGPLLHVDLHTCSSPPPLDEKGNGQTSHPPPPPVSGRPLPYRLH